MTRNTWILIGAAATLYVLHQQQRRAIVSVAGSSNGSGSPHPEGEDANLSAINGGLFGAFMWRNDRPTDDTVSPTRVDGTNPLSDWLSATFGLQVPQIAPAYLAPRSQGSTYVAPMNPAGEWCGSNLGMAAIPGTVPILTSESAPLSASLADPSLLMSVMPYGDDAYFVNDPVMFFTS